MVICKIPLASVTTSLHLEYNHGQMDTELFLKKCRPIAGVANTYLRTTVTLNQSKIQRFKNPVGSQLVRLLPEQIEEPVLGDPVQFPYINHETSRRFFLVFKSQAHFKVPQEFIVVLIAFEISRIISIDPKRGTRNLMLILQEQSRQCFRFAKCSNSLIKVRETRADVGRLLSVKTCFHTVNHC